MQCSTTVPSHSLHLGDIRHGRSSCGRCVRGQREVGSLSTPCRSGRTAAAKATSIQVARPPDTHSSPATPPTCDLGLSRRHHHAGGRGTALQLSGGGGAGLPSGSPGRPQAAQRRLQTTADRNAAVGGRLEGCHWLRTGCGGVQEVVALGGGGAARLTSASWPLCCESVQGAHCAWLIHCISHCRHGHKTPTAHVHRELQRNLCCIGSLSTCSAACSSCCHCAPSCAVQHSPWARRCCTARHYPACPRHCSSCAASRSRPMRCGAERRRVAAAGGGGAA